MRGLVDARRNATSDLRPGSASAWMRGIADSAVLLTDLVRRSDWRRANPVVARMGSRDRCNELCVRIFNK
jgi:hypothetical protein